MFHGFGLYWPAHGYYCRKARGGDRRRGYHAQVVEVTNQGKLHIIGPGMEDMLREVLASGHFKAYTEPQVSDAYFMVVPTPFKGDHEPDVSFVESATRMVLPLLKEGGFVRDRVYLASGNDRTDG